MASGLLSCRPSLATRAANGVRKAVTVWVRPHALASPQLAGCRLQAQPAQQRWQQPGGSVSLASRTVAAAAAAASGEPAQPVSFPAQLLARAVALAVSVWRTAVAKFAAAAAKGSEQIDPEVVNAQIRGGLRNARMLMAVAPLAAISNNSMHTLLLITRAVSSFIKLYLLLLFMRVLLSWFPAFNWEDQPWLALRQITDPYLNLFRGLVPPLLGSIDFVRLPCFLLPLTPLFGFMILQFLAGVLEIQDEESDVW